MQPSRKRKKNNNSLLKLIAVLLGVLMILLIVVAVLPQTGGDPSLDHTTTGSTSSSTQGTSSTQGSSATQSTTSTQGTTSAPPPSSSETTPPPSSGTAPPPSSSETTPPPSSSTGGSTLPGYGSLPGPGIDEADLEAFFAESVFIGDSVTLALRNYCVTSPNALYGAKILCAGSYAVRHAIVEPEPGNKDIVSITYQGAGVRPEDALAQIGAKRVFIMLGMNDLAFGVDYALDNWEILIRNIRAKCPDIEIYIQSATPIHSTKDRNDSDGKGLSNGNMDLYNQALMEFCRENGCYFIDLNSHFKNENGQLADEYCSDPYNAATNPNGLGCHFTQAGVKLWIQLVKEYVTNG